MKSCGHGAAPASRDLRLVCPLKARPSSKWAEVVSVPRPDECGMLSRMYIAHCSCLAIFSVKVLVFIATRCSYCPLSASRKKTTPPPSWKTAVRLLTGRSYLSYPGLSGLACPDCSGAHLANWSFSLFLMHWGLEIGSAVFGLQRWSDGNIVSTWAPDVASLVWSPWRIRILKGYEFLFVFVTNMSFVELCFLQKC